MVLLRNAVQVSDTLLPLGIISWVSNTGVASKAAPTNARTGSGQSGNICRHAAFLAMPWQEANTHISQIIQISQITRISQITVPGHHGHSVMAAGSPKAMALTRSKTCATFTLRLPSMISR